MIWKDLVPINPVASVTLITKSNVAALLGIPEITPAVDIVNPSGIHEPPLHEVAVSSDQV